MKKQSAFNLFFPFTVVNKLKVTQYNLNLNRSGNLRIAVISDLHSAQFGKSNRKLVFNVDKLKPDAIFFTGDIFTYDDTNPMPTFFTVASLKPIAPCFFIPGNHEHRSNNWKKIKAKLLAYGVTVLENQRADVMIKGNLVNILGLSEGIFAHKSDYALSAVKRLEYPDNSKPLKALGQQQGLRIVLSHFPETFALAGKSSYCQYDFDLMVAGHAHGGQVIYKNQGLFTMSQGFLPKFTQGVHGSHPKLVISRGLGNGGSIPRINNPPEIVLLNIN